VKQFFLLLSVVITAATTGFAQVTQDFNALYNMNALTSKCWQHAGGSITNNSSSNNSLALTAPFADGTAWVRTAFVELTTSSTIRFTYQLANPLPDGVTRRLYVRLMDIDGSYTAIGSFVLDHQSGTTPVNFYSLSPVNGVRRLVIEATAYGNEVTPVLIDDLRVDGTYEYNAPYGCKDNEEGTTSIHYLKNFKGTLTGDKVHLQWTVAENENNKYFEIQKSSDGKDYKTVAVINSTLKAGEEAYQYLDALQGHSYYRLKLVTKNNIRMYSNVTYFKNTSAVNDLTILQNPVQQQAKFAFTSEAKAMAAVTLFDFSGRKILQRNMDMVKGYNMVSLPLDGNLKPGMYVLEILNAGNRMTAKILKQ
jgi:hypothetical protein